MRVKFKIAVFVFLVTALNYGCRKNIFSNRIEGEVLGQMTKQPLSGAKVYLVRKIITGDLLGNYQYETVQIAETDPKGKFNPKLSSAKNFLWRSLEKTA